MNRIRKANPKQCFLRFWAVFSFDIAHSDWRSADKEIPVHFPRHIITQKQPLEYLLSFEVPQIGSTKNLSFMCLAHNLDKIFQIFESSVMKQNHNGHYFTLASPNHFVRFRHGWFSFSFFNFGSYKILFRTWLN